MRVYNIKGLYIIGSSNMKKNIIYTIIGVLFSLGYIFFSCDFSVGRCLWDQEMGVMQYIFHVLLALGVILPVALYVSHHTFKQWLVYFTIWLIVDVVWITQSSTTSDYFNLTPTKETASAYMSMILVTSSLLWFALSKTTLPTWRKWIIGVPLFVAVMYGMMRWW